MEYLPAGWKKIAEDNPLVWDKIVTLEKERVSKLSDIKEGTRYFFEAPEYDKEKLLWKSAPTDGKENEINDAKKHLEKIAELLNTLDEKNFMSHNIKEAVWEYAEEKGRGNVLWPFRVALTGLEKSPDPFIVAEILGKNETLKRLERAIDII